MSILISYDEINHHYLKLWMNKYLENLNSNKKNILDLNFLYIFIYFSLFKSFPVLFT